MKFEVFAELKYESTVLSTLILNIQPFKTLGQQVLEERFETDFLNGIIFSSPLEL